MGLSLLVRILEMSLKLQLTKLMGLNLLIVAALCSFGMRQIMDLLSLERSKVLA